MTYVYFFIKSVVKWSEISVRFEFLWELPSRWAKFCEMRYDMYVYNPIPGTCIAKETDLLWLSGVRLQKQYCASHSPGEPVLL